jgi:hypothetical protein
MSCLWKIVKQRDYVSCTGSSSRLPHSSASQPSVPFLSLVPGRGLLGSNTVLGGLAGVCKIHITFLSSNSQTHVSYISAAAVTATEEKAINKQTYKNMYDI